eukprot:gene1656-1208_t
MCEMIESIPLVPYPASFPADFLEGSAKVPVISSARCLCPEADLLSAYVAKMRSKLKLIDDMAASKKSDSIRFKYQRQSIGGYSSPLSKALESSLQQSVEVLTYASSLKQKIHRPFLELQSVVTQLPPLTDVEDIVIQSRKDFEQAEAEYQEHRTHNAILLTVSSLQQELHGVSRDIESFLDKYMSTVGAMTTTGDHKQQSFGEDDVRQLLSCLTKVFAKCGEEPVVISEEDRDILRLLFLEPLLVHWQSTLRKPKSAVVGSNPSSKLTGETLTAVFLKRTVTEMESIVLRFHQLLIEISLQSPSASTKSSSHSSGRSPAAVPPFSPRAEPSTFALVDTWFSQIPLEELLTLHHRLNATHSALATQTNSPAFEEAVQRLQSLRSISRQQLLLCQQSSQRYRQAVNVHIAASAKVRQFVETFTVMAEEELQLPVVFEETA